MVYEQHLINRLSIMFIFTEMMEYCSSRLFVDGNPTKSILALANEDFRIAGELMAMSIVQGGPGPYLFSSVVFNIISRDLKIDDCENSFIKDTCVVCNIPTPQPRRINLSNSDNLC